ncbi:MAG: sugar phosphate isomerase/epimerase family protein [Acidimicrobiia bacterium]
MPHPLALCHYTMIDVAPPDLVTLAAEVGFDAVSLMLQFPVGIGAGYPMHGDTAMRRETRRRLDDCGVMLYDASTCRLEPDTDVESFRPMMESAAYLGAARFNVNGNDPDEARLCDRFAALCALGAEHGVGAGIEFMMITCVRTIDDAVRLITRSAVTNAALTIDAVHLARSGGTAAHVAALDPSLISYVQLCDGPATIAPDRYVWEAGTERMLPGEGELPLRSLVEAIGPDVVVGVEAPSQRRRDAGESAFEYAARASRSLRMLAL